MTVRKAERLTGYSIRSLPSSKGVAYGAYNGSTQVAEAAGPVDWLALDLLVDKVYQLHARIVLELHCWRCARCQRSRPLHVHHRRYRSHGGTHEIDNLEPLCWRCHRMVHQRERSR